MCFLHPGPVIVDDSGQFYGRFTASKFVSDRTRIRALNQLTDLVAGGTSLRDAHERFCGGLRPQIDFGRPKGVRVMQGQE